MNSLKYLNIEDKVNSISLPLIKICEGDCDKMTLENKVRKCIRR